MKQLHYTLNRWPDGNGLGAAAAAEEALVSPEGTDERAAGEESAGKFEVVRETK